MALPTRANAKQRAVRRRIALAVIMGLVVPLIVLELLLRATYGGLPGAIQSALYRVRLSPLTDARLGGPLFFTEYDPDQGTYMSPATITPDIGKRMGTPYTLTTYQWFGGLAFRSPQPAPGTTLDVVALGDSFTFCWVDDGGCWTDHVGRELNRAVTNIGVIGTGAVSQLRRYGAYIADPARGLGQPKLVILQFFGNDYYDDYRLSLLDGTNTLPPPLDAVPPSRVHLWLRDASALFTLGEKMIFSGRDFDLYTPKVKVRADGVNFDLGQEYIRQIMDMADPRNLEGALKTEAAILELRALVEKNGGKLVVFAMPLREVAYRRWVERWMSRDMLEALDAPRQRLYDFCAEETLICFDPLPALQAEAEKPGRAQIYYADDTHINADGNRILAEALAAFLREQGLATP
jgi:hypothetical protein